MESRPELQIFVLTDNGLDCYEGAPKFMKRDGFSFDKPSLFAVSEDGSLLFVSSETRLCVAVFDTKTGNIVKEWNVDCPIVKAHVSPLGTFVQTWHYQPRTKPGEPEPKPETMENFRVWDVKSGTCVTKLKMKNAPEIWPSMLWTSDEAYAARMVTNTVLVYEGDKVGGKEALSLHVKNVAQYSLVCGGAKAKDGTFYKHYRIATFVPAKNNQMSQVSVFKINSEPKMEAVKEVSKTFGRGQRVDFLWNSPASALIIKAFSAVDVSGGSYYGKYDCFYVRVDGSIDVNLTPKREGTIHDVQWDVYGRRFVMVYGPQPASATAYNLKANAIAEFGTGSRNFASFSPSGHLLTLAGFGSLKGSIEVWDHKNVKKAAIAESFAASTFLWSPDSRYFLTAVLADRMKVDNVVKVFSYDGTLVKEINKGVKTLINAVSWRPSPRGVYEALPPSPRCFEQAARQEREMASAPVRQKYVPPGMRASPGATSSASSMLNNLRGSDSATVVGRINSNTNVAPQAAAPRKEPSRHLIPGEMPEEEEAQDAKSKAAEKNRRRREAKKKAKQKSDSPAKPDSVEEKVIAAATDESYGTDHASLEKRLRKLKKKLRQLENLKEKDYDSLLPEQKQKLAEESVLLKLIQELEKMMQAKK